MHFITRVAAFPLDFLAEKLSLLVFCLKLPEWKIAGCFVATILALFTNCCVYKMFWSLNAVNSQCCNSCMMPITYASEINDENFKEALNKI